MPLPTPFHPRTSQLCESMRWKDWSGYFAVCSYDTTHDREYFAIRHAAALIDVSPLFKYEVKGKDAAAFLSRVMAKNIAKLKHDQVTYCCWCDDEGKVMDDGTVTRFNDTDFRVTAAEPSYYWFIKLSRGFDVTIEDSTDQYAALSVQGPNSRELLKQTCDGDLDSLKFFRATQAKFDGLSATITRTGYTGDLGYEVWCKSEDAVKLYDQIHAVGRQYGTEACGLDAMDVSRIEAGFIMNGVDYFSSNHVMIPSRKSSPYEIGLGWTVNLKRDSFMGQEALVREKEFGSPKAMVCLDIEWEEMEAMFGEHGLPPEICTAAWRTPIPIYDFNKRQIGRATSGAFSPTLKKNLALASIESDFSEPGTKIKIEVTVEYERRLVTAEVCETPMFNPERKRSTPNAK